MENVRKEIIDEARQGNRQALEDIVVTIQERIFGLALRMLYDPVDAEDACQEVLIKIISFFGRSTFICLHITL